ncbi:MAG: hypothetical protein LBS64_02985 [Spirochaetaceae bacterium]|jgi:hypothetical protein|nr:hypothetical protein [Spirochaetaceae bacterium]
MSDYLSLDDAGFDVFFQNLTNYVDAKTSGAPPAWPHIPPEEAEALKEAFPRWHEPYLKTLVPHTPVDTRAKNEAKDAAKKVIRPFVNRFLREDWEVVTDMDRDAMGVPTRDKIPTAHPEPAVKPEIDAAPSGQGKHTVTAINPQTQNKRKPALVKGVAFAHKVRLPAEPKARADDMPSVFQAPAVKNFQWGEADYGKVADYAAAYENEGGKRGPWSDVASVIIA